MSSTASRSTALRSVPVSKRRSPALSLRLLRPATQARNTSAAYPSREAKRTTLGYWYQNRSGVWLYREGSEPAMLGMILTTYSRYSAKSTNASETANTAAPQASVLSRKRQSRKYATITARMRTGETLVAMATARSAAEGQPRQRG